MLNKLTLALIFVAIWLSSDADAGVGARVFDTALTFVSVPALDGGR